MPFPSIVLPPSRSTVSGHLILSSRTLYPFPPDARVSSNKWRNTLDGSDGVACDLRTYSLHQSALAKLILFRSFRCPHTSPTSSPHVHPGPTHLPPSINATSLSPSDPASSIPLVSYQCHLPVIPLPCSPDVEISSRTSGVSQNGPNPSVRRSIWDMIPSKVTHRWPSYMRLRRYPLPGLRRACLQVTTLFVFRHISLPRDSSVSSRSVNTNTHTPVAPSSTVLTQLVWSESPLPFSSNSRFGGIRPKSVVHGRFQ